MNRIPFFTKVSFSFFIIINLIMLASCIERAKEDERIIPESAVMLDGKDSVEIWRDAAGDTIKVYLVDQRTDTCYLFLDLVADRNLSPQDTALQVDSICMCDEARILKVDDSEGIVFLALGHNVKGDCLSYIVHESDQRFILLPTNGKIMGVTTVEPQIVVENICVYRYDSTRHYSQIVTFDFNGKELKRVSMNLNSLLTKEERIAKNYHGIIDSAFVRKSFSMNQKRLPYRIAELYPEINEQKAILVVYLHGGEGIGNENERQVQAGIRPPRDWYRYLANHYIKGVIIAPQMASRWRDYVTELKALIDTITIQKNIDPSRIYICGASMGGLGTWDMILAHPGFFAAALPAASQTPLDSEQKITKALKTPICCVTGRYEPNATQIFEQLRSRGGKVKYSHHPEYSHGDACGYSCTEDNIEWMLSHVRRP